MPRPLAASVAPAPGPSPTVAVPQGQAPASRPRATRSWTRAVVQGLRGLGTAAVVLDTVFITVLLPAQPAMTSPWFRLGFALVCCQQLAVLVALWHPSRRRSDLDVLSVLLCVALALMVPHRDQLVPGDLWAPGMYAIPLQTLLLMRLPLRPYTRRAVTILSVLAAIELFGAHFWTVTPSRLCDSLIALEPVMTLQLFAAGLFGMARRHDAGEAKVSAVRAGQATQAAEAEGRREAARLMHDHVLHALHAVSEDRSLVGSQQAVDECRDAIERLDRPSPATRLVQVGDLIAADPALARVDALLVGRTEPLPHAVAQAMAAATHEALSNVAAHAQATHCRVEVTSLDDEGCRVRIVDDGRGFDMATATRTRLGLQRSVRERMHDVGGRAVVTSRPGEGTTVELQWPVPDPAAAAPDDPDWAPPNARSFLAQSAIPGLVATLVVMALMAPRTRAGLPGIVLTCLMTGLALWQVSQSRRRPMGRNAAVLLLGLATAAWVAVLLGAPHGTPNVYDLYVAWGATAAVQVVIPNTSRTVASRLCWALMAVLVVGVACRYQPADALLRMNGAVLAGAVVLIGYRALWLAQDIAAQAESQRQQVQAVHLSLVRMHTLARLDQFWSERVTDEALPLLRGVAEGGLDPDCDEVRRRARSTEALVRDELVLGPGQAAFSEDLHHLRQDGWVVSSSLSRDDGPAALGAARRLVSVLGPAASVGQRVTLSATAGGVSAVVLGAGAAQLATWSAMIPNLGGTVYTDPDFTRLAVRVR